MISFIHGIQKKKQTKKQWTRRYREQIGGHWSEGVGVGRKGKTVKRYKASLLNKP